MNLRNRAHDSKDNSMDSPTLLRRLILCWIYLESVHDQTMTRRYCFRLKLKAYSELNWRCSLNFTYVFDHALHMSFFLSAFYVVLPLAVFLYFYLRCCRLVIFSRSLHADAMVLLPVYRIRCFCSSWSYWTCCLWRFNRERTKYCAYTLITDFGLSI